MIDISNFQFFSSESLERKFFNFSESPEYSVNFQTLGYSSLNAINDMGILFFYIILVVLIYISLFLLGLLITMIVSETNLIYKGWMYLKSIFMYGFLIRFFLESYIEMLISSLL
jgi:hypothetical protein